MHSPVNLRHARLVNFVDRLIGSYIEQKDLGELHREVVAVRLGLRDTFMPDLSYFTKAQVARLGETHAAFAPTMVAEALSPSTAHVDTGRKFAAYEQHGVSEYWILDPQRLRHHFYRREGEMLVEFGAGAERIDSASIGGFWLRRDWLDVARLPAVGVCLREILKDQRKGGR